MSDMVEISKQDLEVLNRARNLLDRMWNDPKDGLDFKKRVKSVLPDARIPELDLVESTTKPLLDRIAAQDDHQKKLTERLDNWEKSQKNSKEEGDLQKTLTDVKKVYSFTDEGMQKVIDRMKEKNNPDAESAAAWVASQEKKAKPINASNIAPSALNLYGAGKEDKMWEELNKDPIGWADRELATMINEFAEADAA